VILAIQVLKEYLNYNYRKLIDVLQGMSRVAKMPDLTLETPLQFLMACVRKQAIPMPRWRAILEYSVDLYGLGEVRVISVTDVDRVQAIQHYTKLTGYAFTAVKPYFYLFLTRYFILNTAFPINNRAIHNLAGRFSRGIPRF